MVKAQLHTSPSFTFLTILFNAAKRGSSIEDDGECKHKRGFVNILYKNGVMKSWDLMFWQNL